MFSFQFPGSQMPYINALIRQGAESCISDSEFIIREVNEFMNSPKRADMIKGVNYYKGMQDILYHRRTVIGSDGEPTPVMNIPNNRIVNNQYKKIVDQKSNYLCGQPITYNSGDKALLEKINAILDNKFNRTIKQICEDSLNCGIGWLFVTYDENGNLTFKRLKPWEVVPGWADDEHTKLEYAFRVYEVIAYEGRERKVITKIEVFEKTGIRRFVLDGGSLIPDGIDWETPYFYKGNIGLNWLEIPLIAFKYNTNEIPLINNVKTLQDGLNLIISNFQNAMEEEPRNTILILKNYDGEDLGEFRKNLATYGAVKVRTSDGSDGGVDTLSVEVNCENYKSLIEIFKKAIIENAMGYDAKDDRLGGNANQMNIQSMYSDIDLDANGMEMEYQASFEELLSFVKAHISNTSTAVNDSKIEVIFNRDMLINESDIIDNCAKSQGMLSDETVIAQHPWVVDVSVELERLKKQREENDIYNNTFEHDNEEDNNNSIDEEVDNKAGEGDE